MQGNPNLNKAILWAAASLDALITVQEVKGIFAGLPWFNNNWGRDTFISLIGSTFCLNNFQDAKEILEAFAAFQIKDSLNEYYGRVPNRITLKESIYNTTDGTPLFVIQCLNYARNSGDTNFIKKNYPVIKIALLGALKYYVDKDCLLTHKDAETWMDAVGPEGPWSPRGNRAVDIQVLWLGQVQATAIVAALLNDTTISALCSRLEPKIVYNIKKKFFDTLVYKIADRITTEGKLDFSERPNSLFATAESTLFKNEFERFKYFSNSAKNILLSQGVLSLSYKDKNFHPYHEYPPFYPKDAAYHNGIIWQWNTGIAVDNLCSFGLQDTAWKLTQTLTNQILNQGAVGSIAELMEVYSRTNSNYTKLSGCFSQAWSLAEYIRSFREAYFGITTDALSNTIIVSPHIPAGINYAKFIVNYKDSKFLYEYHTTGDKKIFKFTPTRVNSSVKVYFKYTDIKQAIALNFCLDSTAAIITVITDKSGLARLLLNKTVQISKTNMKQQLTDKKLTSSVNNFLLAHPVYNKNLKCFAGKAYPLIPFATIKHSNPNAKVIYDKADLPFDEKYTYPQNSNFRAGISDILNFNLSEDGNLYYFTILLRDLVNPGWHPEYGFQLTYLAILIRNSNSNFCNTVNKNSNYILSDSLSYNKAIFIGGGIEVSNYDSKIIAQYIPAQTDITNPLGNIYEKSLRFAIPKRLLGKINNKCKITLLSGTQDDNGGAGLGIFRNVTMQVSEWSGGGKTNSNDNIYDELFIP